MKVHALRIERELLVGSGIDEDDIKTLNPKAPPYRNVYASKEVPKFSTCAIFKYCCLHFEQ